MGGREAALLNDVQRRYEEMMIVSLYVASEGKEQASWGRFSFALAPREGETVNVLRDGFSYLLCIDRLEHRPAEEPVPEGPFQRDESSTVAYASVVRVE